MSTTTDDKPTILTLDKTNSLNILIQYIKLIQEKSGAFDLKEADLLKRSIDVLTTDIKDPDITSTLAVNILIQGIHKGQAHGKVFTLNDASLLHKVIQYIINTQEQPQTTPQTVPQTVSQQESKGKQVLEDSDDEDSLNSLSDPVPLRPRHV